MGKERVDCPDCSLSMFEYEDGDWLIWICWECGYFKSNSPGYNLTPNLFNNIIKENPQKFIEKYLFRSNTENKGADRDKGAKPP